MPLSRSSSTKEVGLRLLFCPLGSNIILRTACSSVGVALPVYSRQLRGKIKMSNTSGSCIGQLMEVLALLRYLQTSFLLGLPGPADQTVEGGVLNVDPNQPEGCNAIEDLDGITSDTDIESNLEVEETLITHVSLGKFSYSCHEPRTHRRLQIVSARIIKAPLPPKMGSHVFSRSYVIPRYHLSTSSKIFWSFAFVRSTRSSSFPEFIS